MFDSHLVVIRDKDFKLKLPAFAPIRLLLLTYLLNKIKTHGSESQGQEAAVRNERVSYLHVALL